MLLFILFTLFVLASGQVANQSPILDGALNTDWTQGSVLLKSETFQWNVQWTLDTFYVGSSIRLPDGYDPLTQEITVRLFFDSITPRPKYSATVPTSLGNTGATNFTDQIFPFPVMVDFVIACSGSPLIGASTTANCTRYFYSAALGNWQASPSSSSIIGKFFNSGISATFEVGFPLQNISNSNNLPKTTYFLADAISVVKATGVKLSTLATLPNTTGDYYGFPLLANSLPNSYPPANFACYLSHFLMVTTNASTQTAYQWQSASTWFSSNWAPDSSSFDTVAVVEGQVSVSPIVSSTVGCLVTSFNFLLISGTLTVNNKYGKDGTSYIWNMAPSSLDITGNGNFTVQAPAVVFSYSNITLNGGQTFKFVANTSNYASASNLIQFDAMQNNISVVFNSGELVTEGPVMIVSDMPLEYVSTALYVSGGAFPGSQKPSGIEWNFPTNKNVPANVVITSVNYNVSVDSVPFGAYGNVYLDGSNTSLTLRATGGCANLFQPCVASFNKIVNQYAPVLVEGLGILVSSTPNTNFSSFQCSKDSTLWVEMIFSPGFVVPVEYSVITEGSAQAINSTIEGVTHVNLTFVSGSSDTATVNVTNSAYSSVNITYVSYNSSGNPISESPVQANQAWYTFSASQTFGSYRIKLYDLSGCLSYMYVHVAVVAPSPSPTPSITATPSLIVVPNGSVSPSSSPHADNSGDKSSDSSVFIGAISGAVAGTLVLAALIGLCAFFIINKRKKSDPEEPQEKEDKEPRVDVEMKSVEAVQPSKSNYAKGSEWDIKYSEIQLGNELGRGAFGVVYKCRWRNTDCVVKQLDIKKNDDHSIQQFLKEATNVRNLRSHPNVCTIFGVCTDPQYPICIVMEYLPEGSLDHIVYQDQSEFKIDLESFFDYAKDIASGMSHLHAENILHCDLACRNLLLAAKPTKGHNNFSIKIADFGLSRVTADEYSASNDATFPVRWSAPETLKSNRVSRASDVYSFGVVLWEIAEGKRPWIGLSNQAVVDAVVYRGEKLLPPTRLRLPNEVWNLITQCWSTNPQDRPTFNEIYATLINLEQTCLDEKAQQAKKMQHILIEEQQRARVISSDGSSSGSSNNNNHNNNYGFALKKLSENVSTETNESTGHVTNIQLPESNTEHNHNNTGLGEESNYRQSVHSIAIAQPQPQYNAEGEEYVNTSNIAPDEYLNVMSNQKK